MSKRDMSAQRTEESSRQSLQIMQPAGLNNSSQRTRNLSGTVRQARKLLLQIEYPASLTTRQRSGRRSGSQDQSPRISDQLVVGPAGDAAALRPAFRCPTGLALFHQHRQRYSGNMSIESSAARAIQRNEAAKMRRCKLAQLRAPRLHLGPSQANQRKAVLCSRAGTVMVFYCRPRPQGGRVTRVRPML